MFKVFTVLFKFNPQFVVLLLLVFVTEVAVVVLGYVYRAKVGMLSLSDSTCLDFTVLCDNQI